MSGALAGLVILVIGDSHMFNLMSPLHSQLEDQGAVVHSYAMCGATAQDWLSKATLACGRGERHDKGPPMIDYKHVLPTYQLSELIATNHPNLIIVELGDVMEGYSSGPPDTSWIRQQVGTLSGKIAANHISCVWVGPTWGQDKPPYNKTESGVKAIVGLLSQSVAPCRYIDSTTFVRPGQWPTKDGSHLMPDGYRQWGQDITNAVVQLKGQGALAAR
ncbi:MAG TPA: SGNH/GDSL hydrolase family protein [Stellaceae bacterium]|nr:SGNH/GDSL hydrolase family protein [Stellaceae bacterium]